PPGRAGQAVRGERDRAHARSRHRRLAGLGPRQRRGAVGRVPRGAPVRDVAVGAVGRSGHLAHPGPHREAPCAVRHGPARRRPAGRGRGGRRARRADRTVARTRRERRMSGPDLPDLSSLPIFHDTEPDRPGPRRPGNGGGAGPDRRPSPPQNTWTASVEQTARPTGAQPGRASQPGPGGPGANGAPPSGGAASPWVGAVARAEREYHGQPGNPRLRDAEFWRQVNSLRGEVSSRLTTALSTRELDE